MGIQQEQVAMGANKRSRSPSHDEHDEEDQQAVADAEDYHHHLNPKEEQTTKEPGQLAVPWMTDEMAAMASVLPRWMTEYTSEDAARFDEDMARTEEWLDGFWRPRRPADTSRKPGVYMAPGLLAYDSEDEEEVVVSNVLRVTKGEIKMLQSFVAQSGYLPISERYLSNRSFITEADADKIRNSDRLFSKLYSWSQEGAKEVLRQYDADANKGSRSPADGGSTCSSNTA